MRQLPVIDAVFCVLSAARRPWSASNKQQQQPCGGGGGSGLCNAFTTTRPSHCSPSGEITCARYLNQISSHAWKRASLNPNNHHRRCRLLLFSLAFYSTRPHPGIKLNTHARTHARTHAHAHTHRHTRARTHTVSILSCKAPVASR